MAALPHSGCGCAMPSATPRSCGPSSGTVSPAALRAKALQLRSLHEPRGASASAGLAGKNACPTLPSADSAVPGQVQSIWADAHLANWDADAQFDGLLLRVVPLDC